MGINLINVLQKSFSDNTYLDISQHVGINPESTKNGLKAIIPVVLASILGNNTVNSSAQPVWWNALDNEYPYTEDDFILTQNIQNSSFLVKGREVISGMFRTNYDELVASVSSVSGIQKEKSAGLIEVGVPLIIGHLKNWMRRKGWKFNDLTVNLIENKSFITGALPIGISPAHFGVGNIPNNPIIPNTPNTDNTPENNFSETIKVEIPTEEKPIEQKTFEAKPQFNAKLLKRKRKNNGLIWFGGLLLLAIVLWYFMGKGSCSRSLDNEDLLVPGVTDTIASIQSCNKSMERTYYASEIMPELILRD